MGDSRTVFVRRFSAYKYGIEFGVPPLKPTTHPGRSEMDPGTKLVETWNTVVRSVRRRK
jgi:hypothetical protein